MDSFIKEDSLVIPPRKPLELNIDPPRCRRRFWVPGDLLTGVMVSDQSYKTSECEPSIVLVGLACTRIRGKRLLRSNVRPHELPFIEQAATVVATKKNIGFTRWIFELRIPTLVSYPIAKQRSKKSRSDDDPFCNSPGHDLPPTLDDDINEDANTQSSSASIIYTLRASVTEPSSPEIVPTTLTCHHPIPFSPLRIDDPRHILCYILPSTHQEAHAPLQTPKLSLTIQTLTTGTTTVGSHLIARLWISNCTTTPPTPIQLCTATVAVTARTTLLVPRRPRCLRLHRHINTTTTHTVMECYLPPSPTPEKSPVAQNSEWDLNALIPSLNTASVKTPSFTISTIARSYNLIVSGALSVDRRMVPFRVETPLLVLPRYSREEVFPLGMVRSKPSGFTTGMSSFATGDGSDNDFDK